MASSSQSSGGRNGRWRGSPGKRCYAIGDVHGRLDLLDDLLRAIEADHQSRPRKEAIVVMMGDLIDRGPDSRGVVQRLKDRPPSFAKLYCILGNHEEALVRGLSGEGRLLPGWLEHGGYDCAKSYGVRIGDLFGRDEGYVEDALRDAVPEAHVRFLAGFVDSLRFGDYLLVHAGIRPGVPLSLQRGQDLRWIREEFLTSSADHGFVVVHGHTIAPDPEVRPNRIGVDTGAYKTGVLTALRIEDDELGFLQAKASP
jgi:serine/threonine protein phosphatase 1